MPAGRKKNWSRSIKKIKDKQAVIDIDGHNVSMLIRSCAKQEVVKSNTLWELETYVLHGNSKSGFSQFFDKKLKSQNFFGQRIFVHFFSLNK